MLPLGDSGERERGESPPSRTALLGRARLSCLPCRKRKSKCDEKAPCSSCTLRGTEDICQLPEKTAATTTTITNSPLASTSKAAITDSGLEERYLPLSPSHKERASTRSTLKRQRLTEGDHDRSAEALEEISRLKKGLDRLQGFVETHDSLAQPCTSPFQESSRWMRIPVPSRATTKEVGKPKPTLVRDAAGIFPSRSDCEILLEYLTQETDWLVNCTTAFWLQPIWSRLIHGARVTQAEINVISGSLAVAAFLLSESPHVYYVLSEPASGLHLRLFQYTFEKLRRESEYMRYNTAGQNVDLDSMIAFGLALDYTRFSGTRRKEGWMQLKASIRKRMVDGGLMDEKSGIWENWNEIEQDAARRIVWQLIVDESWSSLYSDQRGLYSSYFSLQKGAIAVRRPHWIPARLAGAFGAGPVVRATDGDAVTYSDMTPSFRPAAKITARVHRLKDEMESLNAAEISGLAIELAEWAARASEYISAIKTWQKESVAMAPYHRDQDREALLARGLTLCDQIKAWRTSIQSFVCEPGVLDATDFHDCRKASQASTIHTGVRQILNAMLAAWVTQDLVTDVSSRKLIKLQREALSNAKDTVRTIGLTKTLLSCGITTYFGCWAAFSFFNAATTLAIPLLGGQKVREEARKAREKLGGLSLTDRYTSSSVRRGEQMSKRNSGGLQPPAAPPTGAAAPTMIMTGVLSMEELRTLAPDILQILEFLPMIQTSPLGKEATHRLSSLVDAYGIGLPGSGGSGTHSPHDPFPLTSLVQSHPRTDDKDGTMAAPSSSTLGLQGSSVSLPSTDLASATSGQSGSSAMSGGGGAALQDSRGYAVLDSLVALDDAWWDQLFATETT